MNKLFIYGKDTKYFIIKDHPVLQDAAKEFRFLNKEFSCIFGQSDDMKENVLTLVINDSQTFDFNDFMNRNNLKLVGTSDYYYDSITDEQYDNVITLHFNFI